MARKQTPGVPQADGRIAVEPTMDVDEVGAAVAHMANLPLSTNILTHDHHGDQDAVRRAWVAGAAFIGGGGTGDLRTGAALELSSC